MRINNGYFKKNSGMCLFIVDVKKEKVKIEHVKMAEMHLQFKHSDDKTIHHTTPKTMARKRCCGEWKINICV